MAAGPSVDLSGWLDEQLAQASPDLLRGMVKTFAEALMGAEADAICGAPYRERSEERTNSRNGYRRRDWDTRAGTIEWAISKLREGSYFPDWLLERQRRAEAALISVVAACYLGVSTRRMDRLVHRRPVPARPRELIIAARGRRGTGTQQDELDRLLRQAASCPCLSGRLEGVHDTRHARHRVADSSFHSVSLCHIRRVWGVTSMTPGNGKM